MSYDPNPYILYGALVGGPDQAGEYNENRKDFKQTEVTCDYNAGFQSAVAGIIFYEDWTFFPFELFSF